MSPRCASPHHPSRAQKHAEDVGGVVPPPLSPSEPLPVLHPQPILPPSPPSHHQPPPPSSFLDALSTSNCRLAVCHSSMQMTERGRTSRQGGCLFHDRYPRRCDVAWWGFSSLIARIEWHLRVASLSSVLQTFLLGGCHPTLDFLLGWRESLRSQ